MSEKEPRLHSPQPHPDETESAARTAALRREFKSIDAPSARRVTAQVSAFLGALTLVTLLLYGYFSAIPLEEGGFVLHSRFFPVSLALIGADLLLTVLLLFLGRSIDLKRYEKKRSEADTEGSVIRLFKEEIDLPYVVTDDTGKIIVANRAFEEAVDKKSFAVGEDIRQICRTTLDEIIRSTAAEAETDLKLRDVRATALRAYPTILHEMTTADACIKVLQEIGSSAKAMGAENDTTPGSPLHAVYELASDALREAEKRSELWRLCTEILESILTEGGQSATNREKLAFIYDLAKKAYVDAIKKEEEYLHTASLREFTTALTDIIAIAENDPATLQLASAFRLRLDMFEKRDLDVHARTLVLNLRKTVLSVLPNPSIVSDDPDTIALQNILKACEEAGDDIRLRRFGGQSEEAFVTAALTSIRTLAVSVGTGPFSRALHTIHDISDAALAALTPARHNEYMDLVVREILSATELKKESSPIEREIHQIAVQLKDSRQSGSRIEEENFIGAFRDAITRIEKQSGLGLNTDVSSKDQIIDLIQRETSGALAFLELRTSGLTILRDLIHSGEELLLAGDILPRDRTVAERAVKSLKALRESIQSVSATTTQKVAILGRSFSDTLSQLLAFFDERGNYHPHGTGASTDDTSAVSQMRRFYSKIERAASTLFPTSADQIGISFIRLAGDNLKDSSLYAEMLSHIRKHAEHIPTVTAASGTDVLEEISRPADSERIWQAETATLLLHIGIAKQQLAANKGTIAPHLLTTIAQNAETVFEKLTVRRVLIDALVTTPTVFVSSGKNEGTSDLSLYHMAAGYYRNASLHRARLLASACNTVTSAALSFLSSVSPSDPEDTESPIFALRNAARAAQTGLAQSDADGTDSSALFGFASSLLRSCLATVESEKEALTEGGVYYAAISYLLSLLDDMNARLLRRELYSSYRNTASVIVSRLSRAEYSRTAVEQIHSIAGEILAAAEDSTISFSGHLLRKFCSEGLREIAGRTGVDVIRKVTDYAEDCSDTLLNAKAIWELRKNTIAQLRVHLDESTEAAACYTAALRLDRKSFLRLCYMAEKAKATDGEVSTVEREKLTSHLKELIAPFTKESAPEEDSDKKKQKRNTAYEQLAASPSGKALLRAASELAATLKQNPQAPEQAFADFAAVLLPILRVADEHLDEKKRIAQIRKALEDEARTLTKDAHITTLSSRKIYDVFAAYLHTSIEANADLRDRKSPLGRIYRVWANAAERIEDDPSPYLRLYTEASISFIANRAGLILSGSRYAGIVTPLAKFLSEVAKSMHDPSVSTTKEQLLRLSTYAFRVIDAHYEMGEIATSVASAVNTFLPKATDSVSPSDCSKLNHAATDIRRRIQNCRDAIAEYRPTVKKGSFADTSTLVAIDPLRDPLDTLTNLFGTAADYSDKNIDENAFREILSLLREVSRLTAPYLPITDKTETIAFRAEISKIRRQIKDVADATEESRSRAVCAAALSALAQLSRAAADREEVAQIADHCVAEITAIPGGEGNALRVYAKAISALLDIATQTEQKVVRSRLSEILLDLCERREIRTFLVDAPSGELSKAFRDPTDDQIYGKAKEIYRSLSSARNSFYADILSDVLQNALLHLSSFAKPKSFDKLSSVADALMQSANKFEAELRSLIKSSGEQFIPTATRLRAEQLRDLLLRLFELGKSAAEENRDDTGKEALAKRITLIATEGIIKFDTAMSGRSHGAIDRIPEFCRVVSQQTRDALKETEISDTHLLSISRRAKALHDKLTTAPLMDMARQSVEEQTAAFASTFSIALSEIEQMREDVDSFLSANKDSALPGKTAALRSKRLMESILDLMRTLDARKKRFTFGRLTAITAGVPKVYAATSGNLAENAMVAIFDPKGRPSGRNTALPREKRSSDQGFMPVVSGKEESYYRHGLSVAKTVLTEDQCVMLGDRRYLARSHAHSAGGREYYLVTFTEVEATLRLKRTAEDDNTVVALITLDNLEELAHYVRIDYRDAKANVESALREFAGSIHGIFHEQERDKYILFFSQKEMAPLVNNRFADLMNRLEEIKLGDSSVSVTISMGISALGDTLTVKEQNASLALDTALRRGGAQVAIYRDDDTPEGRYEFFSGNQQKGLQNENRVSARVVADYLCELIRRSSDVLIMGHSFPDFDSIGSCVGIAALARYYKKDVHIVTNKRTQNFIDCTPDLLKLPEYQNVFIDATTGMELKGTNTLLVLCDVSNINIMESQDLARTSFNTVIIDHHIKAAVSDDLRTALTYVDPSASSASELVSEILSESLPKNELKKEEANVLLSGIMVDTKNFTKSVGARTFAAALYLRQMGANAEISSTYFFEESSDYKAEVVFRRNLTFHPTIRNVAITFCTEVDLREDADIAGCNLRVAASKAADKLLTVRGVQAAFSLYPYRSGSQVGVSISGRSDGTINVQQILEAFKGGGHFDSAGAAVKDTTVDATIKALIDVISAHFAENGD